MDRRRTVVSNDLVGKMILLADMISDVEMTIVWLSAVGYVKS